MSADRELLGLAAKAAELHGFWVDAGLNVGSDAAPKIWNPLTDDGDALRLAVKLRMDVKQWNSLVIAVKAWNSHAEENTFTQCPYAATRRAIVRAAAAIGKAKP